MGQQGGQITNIPFPNRGVWSDATGGLTTEAISVFEELNNSLLKSIQNGQFDPNGILYGDVDGNLRSLSVTDYTLIYGDSSGVPQTLTFDQDQFVGTLNTGGIIAMTKLQVTDQLDLTGMVGKSAGIAVADAVNATASAVSVVSPDAPVASGAYNQTNTQTTVNLVNEMKSDVNQLVTDLNASITAYNLVTGQLNALISSLRGGELIDT